MVIMEIDNIILKDSIDLNFWAELSKEINERYNKLKELNAGIVKLEEGKVFDLSLDNSLKLYEKLINELKNYEIDYAKI